MATNTELSFSTFGFSMKAVFPSFDESQAQESLGVLERARETGKDNKPARDATEPGADEQAIINHFKQLVSSASSKVRYYIAQINNRLEEIRLNITVPSLTRYEQQLKKAIQEEFIRHKGELIDLRKAERYYTRELRYFKSVHNRKFDASYPESQIFNFGILLAVLLGEAIVNMYLFAQSSEFGLLGGIFESLFVSLVNVALAFCTGFFACRYILHVNSNLRMLGLIGTVIGSALSLIMLLVAAHYRDIKAAQVDVEVETSILAIDAFVQNPIGFQTFEALALLILGLVCALVAGYKGFTFDEPYPGYGKVSRLQKEAERSFQKLRAVTKNSCLEVSKSSRRGAGQQLERYREQVKAYKLASSAHRALTQEYDKFRSDIQDACNNVLAAYRERNRKFRTDPVPSYFSDTWRLADEEAFETVNFNDDILGKLEDGLKKFEENATRLEENLDKIIESEMKILEKQIDDLDDTVTQELKRDESDIVEKHQTSPPYKTQGPATKGA